MSTSAGSTAWGSTGGFLMASIGFAVGLGNIWRFPYVTGENGGSAFVVVYLGCAFLIGVPILMAEIMLGRRGGFSPPASINVVAGDSGLSRHWSWVGYLTSQLHSSFKWLMQWSRVGYFTISIWP